MSKSKRTAPAPAGPARIEALKVKNYRALAQLELADMTPMTVLVGPNGSGKSTVFDVFSFLSECFQLGLRHAWEQRNRAAELKTRGKSGPISIEIRYRERPSLQPITYHLAIDEQPIDGRLRGPVVVEEWLRWKRTPAAGAPYKFLDYRLGKGMAIAGETPEEDDQRVNAPLTSPDLLAVSTLGQFEEHPRVAALRNFIIDWYVSYLSVEDARGQPQAGPQERLSKTGDNLANVIQYLSERHPRRLEKMFEQLRLRVPRLEKVLAEPMRDGRLLLQIKDAPFKDPILARFASDGTLKMLAYLVLLYDPNPPRFIGIEEPENFLHVNLLHELAEECRSATAHSQLLVTTHSPFFLNALKPEEVWVLQRDDTGYTQARRASEIPRVRDLLEDGASLGELWTENHLGGDPLSRPLPGKER